MPDQPMDGVRVLDLSYGIAGPYCTKLLADFGADVVKIEPPGSGDITRATGPFYKDSPHPEKSGLFLNLNANKRSITLDLENSAARKIATRLAAWADVLVENFTPGVLERLGLGFPALENTNPRLVVTSITDFGQSGPYREYRAGEAITFALSGLMNASGLRDREPMKLGANVIHHQAGAMAALHTLIALRASEATGTGEHVDISIQDVQTGTVDRGGPMLQAYQYTGQTTRRGWQEFRGRGFIHRCNDGYINISAFGDFMPRALRMIGKPELLDEPRFSGSGGWAKQESIDAFNVEFEPWLLEHGVHESWMAAQRAKLLAGPIYTPGQLASDAHLKARGYWTGVETRAVESLPYPGRPFILHDSPWSARRPAPALGEHNREIYCGLLGFSRAGLVKLREAGAI